MPPMGESIFECTILNWLVKEGDFVTEDDMVIEVATDKIDTEIGATVSGKITKFLVNQGDIATIGNPICLVEVAGESNGKDVVSNNQAKTLSSENLNTIEIADQIEEKVELISAEVKSSVVEPGSESSSRRFYSPLVLNIAHEENISREVLDTIRGSGKDNRVTKVDILEFVKNREVTQTPVVQQSSEPLASAAMTDEIIEMTRMRKVISERMVASKRTAPHVTSFVEVDMTEVVDWRNKVKKSFEQQNGEKITFTPILIQAIVRAIQKFPMINIQVDGGRIIKKKDINIGMAVALPDGNLIVPVIKNADSYSLVGLTKKVNDLAERARNNQLKPDELTGGTYTISNIGGFGNLAGTPIIVQPQVAIMAFGVILKKPAVVETPSGDFIGIRHKMIISHSYDHRVVDGSLGGLFAKEVANNLETFQTEKTSF